MTKLEALSIFQKKNDIYVNNSRLEVNETCMHVDLNAKEIQWMK